MLVVGLTGGIGSGKSTFAALLAERGAIVIDADALGREALAPGAPGWSSVVGQFGDEIIVENTMDIDRPKLGRIVFTDPRKLAVLNEIVHPIILRGIADELDVWRSTDEVVVIDAALIVELGLTSSLDMLIAITADESTRQERLKRHRRMSLEDSGARMAAQGDPREIADEADVVVRNDGSLEELAREADRVWAQLQERRR